MIAELAVNLLASAVLVAGGYLWGKYRERQFQKGRRLEEFDFYPFGVDEEKVLYFDEVKFLKAVDYFLKHRNDVAVRQLLLVGQQNDVENSLSADGRLRYRKLYSRYGGDKIRDDMEKFLGNYRRIVRLIGDSFPDTGIEIILHDLTNPATALSCIKNNVTGRDIGSPATNLVFDLKTRKELSQDKLNYELNIGARRFKCTTIPIFRDPDGLVGAICINVDVNFLKDEVLSQTEKMEMFLDSLCKTDMNLDENILSKDEYQKALAGKRHFRDFSPTA
ncbi:MAG TPA: PAS domain-containing protein [Woeseiaceae bacterium]|jgi:predicted transcriptional regulator YheO|nr:PAS domain-containing protein [Woeseiaceae bacterium]